MKKIVFSSIIAISILASISSCRKDVSGCTDSSATNYNSAANINNGSCTYTGNITFWFSTVMTNATVTIFDASHHAVDSGVITSNYPNGLPGCGANGCANFTLPIGIYTYTARSSTFIWNDTATVIANHCNLYQLQ
jgi:hypothetical protein